MRKYQNIALIIRLLLNLQLSSTEEVQEFNPLSQHHPYLLSIRLRVEICGAGGQKQRYAGSMEQWPVALKTVSVA